MLGSHRSHQYWVGLQDAFNTASTAQKNNLSRIGLGGLDASSLSFQVISVKASSSQNAAEAAKQLQKSGIGFIPIIDSENGTFVAMKGLISGEEKNLTSAQINMMTRILGGGILNVDKLQDKLSAGEMSDFMNKLPKRLRAFFSERDVTITESDILGSFGGKNMEDGILRVDSGIDYLKKHLGLEARVGQNGEYQKIHNGKQYNLIDELLGSEDQIGNTIKNIGGQEAIDILSRPDIRAIVESSSSSKELLEELGKKLSSDEYQSIEKVVKGVRKEFDGISPHNINILKYKKNQIKLEIEKLQYQISGGSTGVAPSLADANKLKEQLYELTGQSDILDNANNLYQVSLRGGMGEEQFKSAAYFTDFDKLGRGGARGIFSSFAGIYDEEAIKSDLGIKFNGLVISGLGSNSSGVYADAVSTSFLGEIFSTPEDIENIRAYSNNMMNEFRGHIENGTLPPDIKGMLRNTVYNNESEWLPSYMSEASMRNRDFAKQILEMHQSGISPRDSPKMMNMIASLHASEMYRIQSKKGIDQYMPRLPDVKRFAVSSEASASLGGQSQLPPAMQGVNFVGEKGNDITSELMNFRVNDGRVLFGPGMVDKFYQSLGGFDLDDKVLTKIMTYNDKAVNGKKRLVFGMYRQPSGPQESIYAKAILDEDTLRSYFGDKNFKNLFNEYKQNTQSPEMDELFDVLWNQKKYTNLNSESAEELILQIYDSSKSKGGMGLRHLNPDATGVTGSHNRRILRQMEREGSDLQGVGQYTRESIYKIFTDESKKAGDGFLILDEFTDLLKTSDYTNAIDTALHSQLLKAAESRNIVELNRLIQANRGDNLLGGLLQESTFAKMFNVAQSAEGALLGTYVNRTMLIGSKMNQTEDLIEELYKIGGQDSNIQKILNIRTGLFAQETAIDFSKNASGAFNQLDITTSSIRAMNISAVSSFDPAQALKLISSLEGNPISNVGEQGIRNLGRRIGTEHVIVSEVANQMIANGEDATEFLERYLPKIDEILLGTRLHQADAKLFQDAIIGSIEGTAQDKSVFKEILDSLRASDDSEKISASLIKYFGANANSAYAGASAISAEGLRAAAIMAANKRLYNRGNLLDSTLLRHQYDEGSGRVADYLIAKHNEEISRIANFGEDISLLPEIDRIDLDLRKMQSGQAAFSDIREGARRSGVSMEQMINTIEKRAYQSNSTLPYDDLRYGTSEGSVSEMFNAARTKRRYDFYEKIRTDLRSTIDDIGTGPIDEIEKRSAEAFRLNSALPTTKDLDILALLSEDEKILESHFGGAANVSAARATNRERIAAIRSNFNYENLQDEYRTGAEFTQVQPASAVSSSGKVAEDIERVLSGENVVANKGTFTRLSNFIKDGSLKKLFNENKTFKNTAVGIGALVVASFAYQHFSDRTPEQMQGPALLPGGSAYEENYPQRMAELPQIGTMSYNPGINYKVNLFGDRGSVEDFRKNAMGLGKFNTNTTMYRRTPQLGRNPYQEVASSF